MTNPCSYDIVTDLNNFMLHLRITSCRYKIVLVLPDSTRVVQCVSHAQFCQGFTWRQRRDTDWQPPPICKTLVFSSWHARGLHSKCLLIASCDQPEEFSASFSSTFSSHQTWYAVLAAFVFICLVMARKLLVVLLKPGVIFCSFSSS